MWCDGIRTSILQLVLRWNVLKSLIDLLSHYWKHETSTSQIFLSNSPKITEPLLLLLMFYFTYIMENGADIKRSLLKYTNCSSAGLLCRMIGRMFAACLVWGESCEAEVKQLRVIMAGPSSSSATAPDPYLLF